MHQFNLSSSEVAQLDNPGLVKNTGGHQSFFMQMTRQRTGHIQEMSDDQLVLARERAYEHEGTWQEAYRMLLRHADAAGV